MAPKSGPRLHIPDDDDDDDDEDDSDEVDSDVERMAAESLDRRRQTAAEKTVIDAKAKLQDEAVSALEAQQKELKVKHKAAIKVLQNKCNATESKLKELQGELEETRADAARARTLGQRDNEALEEDCSAMAKRCQALKEELTQKTYRAQELEHTFKASEVERLELERGILRARDIVAAKDEMLRVATERGDRAVANEALNAEASERLPCLEVERTAATLVCGPGLRPVPPLSPP